MHSASHVRTRLTCQRGILPPFCVLGRKWRQRTSVSPSLLLGLLRRLGVFALLAPLFAARPSLSPHCAVGAVAILFRSWSGGSLLIAHHAGDTNAPFYPQLFRRFMERRL